MATLPAHKHVAAASLALFALSACSSSTPSFEGTAEPTHVVGSATSSASASPTASPTPSATPTPSPATTSATPSQVPTVTVIEETPSVEPTSPAADSVAETETREDAANAVPAVDAGSALAPEVQTALDTLNTFEVKGRAPKTGYSREEFGQRWADTDHNGCDTRNDILARDFTNITYKTGSRACVVATGVLSDPYTGGIINFVRGQDTSEAVQIDHVVAMSDAWQTGAQQLSPETRELFANDPINLLAVDGPSNQQKSDGDAATWLPSNASYRCTYVSKQIAVKAKYHLWVKEAEKTAMVNVLSDCGAQQAPVQQAPAQAPAAPEPVQESPVVQAPAQQAPVQEVPAGGDVYYKNCTEARAAGAAPLYRGQPGYRDKMDGDGDDIACEVKK